MSGAILLLNAAAAIVAILFVLLYTRILVNARRIGPTPSSWILMAVGMALIAAYAVLELVQTQIQAPVVLHTERVYFMLGNVIVFVVLFRIWYSLGGES